MSRLAPRALSALLLMLVGFAAPLAAQSTPYADYPVPGACVAAAWRVAQRLTWGEIWGLQPYDETLRVHADARAAGAACLAAVLPPGTTVASAPLRDVASLFQLGRGFTDDTLADQAFTRFLGTQKIRDDSTSVIWQGLGSWSNGTPPRLPRAQRMAAWLDTLGVVGERPLLPWDSTWYSQHGEPNYAATAMLDTTVMRQELNLERMNYAAVPKTALRGTEMVPISAQAEELLLTLLVNPRADSAVAALKAKALEILGPNQEEGPYGGAMELLGERFRPLHPDFWFHRPSADTAIPRARHVTVVQYVDPHSCTCEYLAASIARLKARFGDALDVVLLAQTFGHYDRRVQLPPAEEAALLSHRILDVWKVDASVGVYTTTFVANAAPDLRLVPQRIPELRRIQFGGGALIVDQRGIFMLAGSIYFGPTTERAMIALIQRLLDAPAE